MKKFFFYLGLFLSISIAVGILLDSFESLPTKTFVSINIRFTENDMFQVFYRLKGDRLKEKNSVRKEVVGSDQFQEIVFELPEVEQIDQLRIDLGRNSQQNKIEVNGLYIYTASKTINLSQKIWEFFKTNSFIKRSGNILHTSIKSNRYDPFMISQNISDITNSLSEKYKVIPYPFLYSSLLAFIISVFFAVNHVSLSIREFSSILFVVAIFTILLLPTVDNIFSISQMQANNEKRELAKFPNFTFSKDFSESFEDYYNDNFGFRGFLIDVGGKYKAKIFNASNNPERAMMGKNGWVFYNTESIFNSYSRSNLLSFEELKTFKNSMEERKAYFESIDKHYLFAFWPNKHSIYPEKLPYPMKSQIKDTLPQADQVIRFLQDTKSKFNIIDVRSALIEKKSEGLYRKLDTHWNSLGAYFSYNEFLKQTESIIDVEPIEIDEFAIEWRFSNEGDLVKMLGIYTNDILSEKLPTLKYKNQGNQFKKTSAHGYPNRTVVTMNSNAKDKRKILFFGDSYSAYLIKFFSLNFKDAVYVRSKYDQNLVEKIQPDIVIDAFVERQMISDL